MTIERENDFTLGGNPVTVLGPKLEVGAPAPDFSLTATNWQRVSLADSANKIRLISVVPSLDTTVCDAQTRRFNEEATNLSNNVVVLTVSSDLPYAQKRWCGGAGVDRVEALSDHYDMNFGTAYGTHVKALRIEQRAVFVIDSDDKIAYAEYVPEIADHPDYEAALAAVKALTKS